MKRMSDILTVDGASGEGGGQIVRSSLALSLVTGRSIALINIRAGRKKSGLRHQHLTAIHAAATVGQAEMEGATLGSDRLVFRPGMIQSGEYRFQVGTAGSTMLVLQTVLPVLALAERPSTLALEGGTHNPMAPPFDFLASAYLPLFNRMGADATAQLERHGFYPAGGGRCQVRILPTPRFSSLDLLERGEITDRRVKIVSARLPAHIAQREKNTIANETGWPEKCFELVDASDSPGPGNIVLIAIATGTVTEVFSAFGQRGVRAERVAKTAVRQAQQYLAVDVPVGEYLADQLLLPLGIGAWQGTGGGKLRTWTISDHTTTHIALLREFLGIEIETIQKGEQDWLIHVLPAKNNQPKHVAQKG